MDITKLTQDDIGRLVIYRQGSELEERGVITSFNDNYIFVRYNGDVNSKATNSWDLQYEIKGG